MKYRKRKTRTRERKTNDRSKCKEFNQPIKIKISEKFISRLIDGEEKELSIAFDGSNNQIDQRESKAKFLLSTIQSRVLEFPLIVLIKSGKNLD